MRGAAHPAYKRLCRRERFDSKSRAQEQRVSVFDSNLSKVLIKLYKSLASPAGAVGDKKND